jgi:hypothetical protein
MNKIDLIDFMISRILNFIVNKKMGESRMFLFARSLFLFLFYLLLICLPVFYVYFYISYYYNKTPQIKDSLVSVLVATTTEVVQNKKINFGTNLPPYFPTGIPIENGVILEQSYGFYYAGQKQVTVVFASTKTVEDNFSLYSTFFTKNGWVTSNQYIANGISTMYVTKGNTELNLVISSSTLNKTQVSLSLLISDDNVVSSNRTNDSVVEKSLKTNLSETEKKQGDTKLQKASSSIVEIIKKHPEFRNVLIPGAVVSTATALSFLEEIGKINPELKKAILLRSNLK